MLQAIILVTILVEAALAVAILKTGRGVLLFVMIGVLVAAAGAYAIDVAIVTDEERVRESLYGICYAMEAKDERVVKAFIHPENNKTSQEAIWAMNRGYVESWRLSGLEVVINEVEFPRTATVGFIGKISGRSKDSSEAFTNFPIRFELQFEEQEDGRWLITNHNYDMDLMKSIKKQ